MNFGSWRLTEEKKTGDCILYHQNKNTLQYEIIKRFKQPKSHLKKNKTKIKNCCLLQ